MAEQKSESFIERIGYQSIITLCIAVFAVFVTTITFKTHVEDFEIVTKDKIAAMEVRIDEIEERERDNQGLLARVDTHVLHLSDDIKELKAQMSTLLEAVGGNY